jgi:hypothetical protein
MALLAVSTMQTPANDFDCKLVDPYTKAPNKECILLYIDTILQFTGGFFTSYEWKSWADVILRINKEEEMIYNCAENIINEFYSFKGDWSRLYEQTPYVVNGTDAYFYREEFGEMPQCTASTPSSWLNEPGRPKDDEEETYCEACGSIVEDFYPKCENVHYGWGNYWSSRCKTCRPLGPEILHPEISYEFMKQSGLLTLVYKKVEFVQDFYGTCVNRVIEKLIDEQKSSSRRQLSWWDPFSDDEEETNKKNLKDELIDKAEAKAVAAVMPLMK